MPVFRKSAIHVGVKDPLLGTDDYADKSVTLPKLADDVVAMIVQEAIDNADAITDVVYSIIKHPPIVGDNGDWWMWDVKTQKYKDTGIAALVAQLVLFHNLGAGIAFGETHTVEAKVYLGNNDITSRVESWTLTRDSGDAVEDEAWATKAKVKNFNGTIDIVWSDEEDDLGQSLRGYTKFTFTAYFSDGETQTAELNIT